MMVMQTPPHFLPQRRVHYKETYLFQYNNARKKDILVLMMWASMQANLSFHNCARIQLLQDMRTLRHEAESVSSADV
jgi:hypothetical protein